MKILVKKGRTSKLVLVFLQDSSSSTGAGLTGLTNASSGLVCYRARADDGNAAGTQLTLSAGTRGTWSSGGFKEKDATNMPGVYELGLDNAGLATGSDHVVYMLTGATNLAPTPIEIQLVDFDPQDSVHLGLTCLPNTAVTTNASLLTSGTGADQFHVAAGIGDANVKQSLGTAVTNEDFTVASATSSTVTLPTTYSSGATLPDDSRYANCTLSVVGGTGVGQLLRLTTATGSARQYNVNATNYVVTLDNTSKCVMVNNSGANVLQVAGSLTAATTLGAVYAAIETGTAQAGTATTITLRSGASAVDNNFKDQAVFITSGTGAGQSNHVTAYVGSTKVATVASTWATTPDNTSVYIVIGRIG